MATGSQSIGSIGGKWGARLLGSQDAAEALRLLAARPGVAGDLDQNIGFRDVDGVVAHLGEEHRVDLRTRGEQAKDLRTSRCAGPRPPQCSVDCARYNCRTS